MTFYSLRMVSVLVAGMGLCAPAMAATAPAAGGVKVVTVKTASNTATKVSSPKPLSPGKDPLVEGAMMCTKYFPRYEREYAIPTHLLSAIASTESGRYHEGLKIRLPWPWTVMSGGVGKFYDTKEQAVAAVKSLKAKGVKNIDVGCMQVNLYHHSDAFANVEQAFEPEYNVNYAANFLRTLYNDDKSWKKAASDYHSKTPALGAKYIGMVYDSWFNIIQKLREARLAVPPASLTAMNELKGKNSKSLPTSKVEPYPVAAVKPAYAAPHMNSISVASVAKADSSPDAISYTRSSQDNGVAVIRNETTAPARDTAPLMVTPQQMAQANPSAGAVNVADNSYVVAKVNKNPDPLPPVGPAVVQPEAPTQAISAQTLAPVPPPIPAPVPMQGVALTSDGSRASASVSLPLTGVTQAAVAPVTGLANTVLNHASDAVAQKVLDHEMTRNIPSSREGDSVATSSFTGRRTLDTASASYKSGPNFIFSE